MEERKCKGKGAIIILSILLVLSLVAGGYFYYKNANKINDLEEQLKNNKNEQVVSNDNENSGELKVEAIKWNYNDYMKLNVPQIINGTKVTKAINEKILKLVGDKLSLYGSFVSSSTEVGNKVKFDMVEGADHLGVFMDYDYLIKNDVLLIAYHIKVGLPPHKTGNDSAEVNYAYDIKNDKEISITDALTKLGYTDEQMDKEMDNKDVSKEAINGYGTPTTIEKKKEWLNKNVCDSYVSIDKDKNIDIVYVPLCM